MPRSYWPPYLYHLLEIQDTHRELADDVIAVPLLGGGDREGVGRREDADFARYFRMLAPVAVQRAIFGKESELVESDERLLTLAVLFEEDDAQLSGPRRLC